MSPKTFHDENESTEQRAAGRMRAVILPGTYDCWNLGDLAMLLVALRRLRSLWPNSELTVLAYEAERFATFCPEVAVSPLRSRDAWLDWDFMPNGRKAPIHGTVGSWCKKLDRKLRVARPGLRLRLLKNTRRWHGQEPEPMEQFLRLMHGADLFIMTGCGGVTDQFKQNALRILETFELAIRLGVPTAMVGQGLGPMRDPDLVRVAQRVLPQVGFIGLRDANGSPALLSRLGVDARRVQVTGDDAVELAYQERPTDLGRHIGVNLRLADYSAITEGTTAQFGQTLKRKAAERGARLLAIPISNYQAQSDNGALLRIFGSGACEFDSGASLDSPLEVIQQTRACRIVVTVSYHAAVFALSMGIPVVGVVQSDYYLQKFNGLADLFAAGCAVVDAKEATVGSEIEKQFDRLWREAPILRGQLIAAAADQVAKGQTAYRSLLRICAGSQL